MNRFINLHNHFFSFFDAYETLEEKIKPFLLENKIMPISRLCLVGSLKGVDLFQLMEILGKEETIRRIEKAIATL